MLSSETSESEPKLLEILHFLKDSKITSVEIPSQACLTYKHTSLKLARRRFPAAVSPALPLAIHVCHSLRRLSLNGLFIETSSGWHTLVNPPGITARWIPLS